MSTFNKQKFKQGLLDAGIDLTEEQINNYLNNKLSTEGQIGTITNDVPFAQDLFEQVVNNETANTDETGRANRHNNPGAHIWDMNRERKYGAKKGDPFVGKDSQGNDRTYYTAKYDTIEQGMAASKDVVESHMNAVVNSGVSLNDDNFHEVFARSYTGLSEGQELDNYASRLKSGMQPEGILVGNNLTSDSFTSIDYEKYKTPEERNAALDFLGNALWNALDTGTMGIAGYLDADDSLQKFLEGEEGPSSFAGRAGAGVGGLAGYMVPMSGARALAGKAISSTSKYGVKKFSSKVASEGSEYLAKSAGVKQKGYKGFKTLTKEKQDGFFKEITDDVINKATKARQVKVDESFAKKLASGSDDAISAALKTAQLPNTQKNITAIRGIIEKALLQNGNKSVVPISSLQQRIAMMAGNVPGSAKIANIATHAIEETFLFAAVETPMEFFQSRNEERDADYVGRGLHSLALGTALGVIKTIPGGKEIIGVDGGASTLSKEIFRKAMRTITGKKPYQSLDVNKISDGKSLKNMVKHQWKGFGNDAPTYFDDALKKTEWRKNNPDKKILTSDHIDELSDTPDGRQALKDILDFSSREWEKRWGPAFMKDAMEDIGGSMKRMILGSMAFNYNVVFDENIPLEDKMFNVLLGAFMSKNHYKSTYIDKDGVVKDLVAGERDMATRLNEANEYLSMLGMKPKDFTFQQLINDANLKSKFFKNAADSEDVQSIVKLLLDNDMLVDANSRISKVAQNKRGQRGDDGLYDALKLLVDGDVLVTENKRMLDPSEITKAKLKKVMKGLSGLNLKDVDVKNIKTPSDLIDIIDHAHDGVWNKFEDLHVKSAASIFNGLSQSSGKVSGVDVQPGKTPTFFEIKVEDSGNLTAPQRRVLDTYNKLLDMLEGRAIKVDRTMPIDINSKHIDDAVINRFEGSNKELDELINGVAGVDQTQSAKLAQEGWTYELFERYAEKRDVRVSYDKLKDLDNPNQFSPLAKPVPGGAQHNGHQIKNLTNDIFIDKSQSYVIYDRINFEGKIPDEQKQFILAYHAYLKQSPEYNIPFLEGQSKTLNIKQGTKKLNDLMDLKKILSEEKITVFLKTGQKLENYLQNYLDYSRHKQLAGVIKTNGKSLNDADRVILSELMDFGLIGKNFEVPEIVGFADEIIKNLEGKANKDFDQFLNEDSVVGSFLKNFSQDVKKEPSDIVKTLKEDWEQFIAPYVKDGQGAGVLKINTRTPAVIDPNEFRALLTFLAEIKVQTNHTSHKDLVNQFEKISNNTGFDKQTRELFQNVYSSLNNPNANIRGVISYMSKNNMYDLIDKEIKFDEKDLTRIEKLREMLNETQLIMDDGEDREIENIVNLYKDKFSKDNDIDVYINESRESIRKAYNFGKDYEFSDKKMDDFIKDGYVEKNGKKYYLDGTDSNPAADGTMSTKERTKYINDITKMLFSNESQRTVLRLTARSAGIDMDSNNRMYDNSLFRTMDHLLTEGPLTKGDTGFAIIDTKFADGNKSINTRGTRDFEVQARRDLLDAFDGKNNKEMIDKSYDSTEDGYLKYETTPGYVVIGVGDLTFDIGIRRDKLPVLAKKLDDLLKDNENTYKDAKYAESHKTLRKLFKKTFNKIKGEGDDEFIYEFKKSQNRAESQALEVLVTHAMMNGVNINGKKTGLQNHWWDHLALTHGKSEGMEVLKKARRMTLLANVSMKELNSNHLDNVINLTNKFGGKLDKDALEALKTIKTNGGLRMLIMEDEDFSKIGTSINRDLQEQIGLAAAKTPEGTTLKGTRPNKGEIDYANGGDISAVDSYTAVSPKIMKGLYKLVGAGNIEGLGGLKPIIHRLGNKIIIGKTAFISDPKITRFLKKNNQDMVMFGSAAKIHYDKSKFIKDWGSLNDLANLRLSPEDLKKTELIGIDEISLGAVVNSDKGASIPYQGFKDISLNQSKEVYDWLISNKLEEYNTSFGDFTNPKNNDGIAFAKMLMQNRTTDNANSLTERLLLMT